MSTQPRALTLAYEYANRVYDHRRHATSETHHDMLVFREALEAELRRLHAVNEELLELLIEAREELKVEPEMWEFISRIDAAIAKAGEQA